MMAGTIIDSLVVELNLDSSKYELAQKRSTESLDKFDKTSQKTNKTQLEGSKKLAEGFAKATSSLVGFATAAVGANGFKNFVATMVTGNAELGRNAKLMGMSAQQITAWGSVLEGVGGKAEDFVGSIQNIKGAIARLRTGTGGQQILAPMNMLGLDLKSVEDPLKLAQAFQRYSKSNGMQAVLARAQDLGVNENTFKAMTRTDKSGKFTVTNDYKAALAQANATKKDTDAAEDLAKKWSTFGSKIDAIKQSLLREFMPTLDKMLDKALLLAGGFEKLDDKTKAWLVTLTAIAGILGTKIFTKAILGLLGVGGAAAAPAAVAAAGGAATAGATAGAAGGLAARVALGATRLGNFGMALGGGYAVGTGINYGIEKYGFDNKASIGTKIYDWFNSDSATSTPASGGKNDMRGDKSLPRGLRNNNLGNLRTGSFTKSHGQIGVDDAGFAIFPDMTAGNKAQADLLRSYSRRGFNTINKMINRYAPSSENDTNAYIRAVSKRTGIGANDVVRSDQFDVLQQAISLHENGAKYAKIIEQSSNIPRGSRNSGASSSEVNIGTITVNTQATDANTMARDVKTAFRNNSLTAASVGGAH